MIYLLKIEGRLEISEAEEEEFEATRELLAHATGTHKGWNRTLQEALRELENCGEVTISLVETR